MAYIDNTTGRNQRATVMVAVALLQGAAILALVNGLAVKFIDRPPPPRVEGQQIPLTPPPQPPKVEEPVKQQRPPEEVRAPLPKPPIDVGEFSYKPPADPPQPPFAPKEGADLGKPPAPPPTPPAPPRAARPKGDPGGWVTADDYPARDLREGNQGVTRFKLTIGPDGKVQACTVMQSSGFASLDAAACNKLTRRARFNPAADPGGMLAPSEYSSAIRWVIPD